MSKKAFIRDAARTLMLSAWVQEKPAEKRIDTAISLAEALWKRLDERGYGSAVEGEPKEGRNWYAELGDQEAFDKSWRKYGRTGARNDAAKAWLKLEEAEKALIPAAIQKYLEQIGKEGTTKAHFATWLNGRRWESFDATPVKTSQGIDPRAQEIAALQKMIERSADPNTRAAFQKQLDKLSH